MGETPVQKPDRIRWLHLAVYLGLVAVNLLSTMLPLNGTGIGEVSDRYFNLLTPDPITFMIWGVIYVLLAAFVLYPFRAFGRRYLPSPGLLRAVSPVFVLSSLLNAAWLVAWQHDRISWSFAVMLALLLVLAAGYRRLEKSRLTMTFYDKLFVRLPFRIYTAWITVATVVNLAALLVRVFGETSFINRQDVTVLFLAVATLAALAVILKYKDAAFGMVVLWAYLGMLFRHIGELRRQFPWVMIALAVALVLVFTATNFAVHNSRHRAGKDPEARILE